MKIKIKTKLILLVLFIGLLLSIATSFTFYLTKVEIQEKEIEKIEEEQKNLKLGIFEQLNVFEHDILILSKIPSIQGITEALDWQQGDPLPESTYQEWRERMQKIFVAFSESKPWYMQIRYIDETGQEIVRVDRKSKSYGVEITKERLLQNKSDRYYFQEASALPPGSIYISEFDLNTERGVIETPFRPTIRYATAVFDSSGKNRGIVIINVLMENLIELLNTSYDGLYLIDEEEYFLINPQDTSKEWGKVLGTGHKYSDSEKEYESIKSKLDLYNVFSEIKEGGGHSHLHTYSKIHYNKFTPDKYWVVVRMIPLEDFFFSFNQLQKNITIVDFFVYTIFVIAFTLFILGVIKPINILNNAVKRLDAGDYSFEIQPTTKDELGDLTIKFNELIKSIREQEKEKREFIASASHQLKTPSSGVEFQLTNLKKKINELSKKERIAALDEVLENNGRSVAIVNDLFKVLEMGDRYQASNLREIEAEKLVSDIIDSIAQQIQENQIDVKVNIPEALKIDVEESRFKVALINLIENAVKYSNKGGEIDIKAEEKDNIVHFEIRDTGIGIPQKDQIYIFDEFFRASNSYLKASVGSGLGLSIAKTVIEGHKGKIWFESEENKGTIFYFEIPKSR
jgi:methyl-accepting chemotaxis protein